ncbi:MAG TPA: DUF2330 domain-containing protein [Thermoanaerobaculia bacterium]|jgi:hypothetical protein
MRRALAVPLLIALTRTALACAPAPPPGHRVNVVEESAAIIWEPASKTEHFIRRATFSGDAAHFGFLVPTPTEPRITAVGDTLFDYLDAATAQKIVHRKTTGVDWTPLLLAMFVAKRNDEITMTAAPPLRVLSTQKVAGYEAAVLDARDAGALRDWLQQHDYGSTPDLEQWLAAYVAQGWKISAFKIDKDADADATTSAVKMSFTTERPFFPYREPASQRDPSDASLERVLRIWFLGPERVSGTIGAQAAWPASTDWSNRLTADQRMQLDVRTHVELPATTRLTAFTDSVTLRPGVDDLFFARDADQRVVVPPPWVEEEIDVTNVPLDLLLVAFALVYIVVRLIVRSSAARR